MQKIFFLALITLMLSTTSPKALAGPCTVYNDDAPLNKILFSVSGNSTTTLREIFTNYTELLLDADQLIADMQYTTYNVFNIPLSGYIVSKPTYIPASGRVQITSIYGNNWNQVLKAAREELRMIRLQNKKVFSVTPSVNNPAGNHRWSIEFRYF